MSLSVGGDAHPAVAPATPTPTSFKKSRRVNTTLSLIPFPRSVVANHAVHGRREHRVVELFPVTAQAPAHLERRVLIHHRHVLDRAMAGLAFDARLDVALVIELDVVGEPVDFDPRHLLA